MRGLEPVVGLQLADQSLADGVQLADQQPEPAGLNLHATSPLPDSEPGGAPAGYSTSCDTDIDTPHAVGPPGKGWPMPSLKAVHAGAKPSRNRGLNLCLPCRGSASATADGPDLPPVAAPTVADAVRHAFSMVKRGLRRLIHAALNPPANASAASEGPLYGLTSRQVEVSLAAWEAYGHELTNRRVAAGRGEREAPPRRSIFGLPLLHPHCGLATAWFGCMLLFDMVFTAFWVPVNVAFCLEQYGNLAAPCTRTDLAGGVIYVANILFSFQVGLTLSSGYRSRVVLDGRDAAALYGRTAALWLDVLAVAPFVYLVVLLGMGDSMPRHQTISVVSLIRLVRLLRVAGIIQQLYTSSTRGTLQPSWLADHFSITPVYAALLVYVASVCVNLFACVWLLVGHYEGRAGRASWMDSISWTSVAGARGARRWVHAVYYVITVMTTTGFADFLPKSPLEQVLVNIIMFIGLVMFGAMVALIGDALRRSQEEAMVGQDARKKLSYIRHWLAEGEVAAGLQRDVLTFFAELRAKRDEGRTEGDIVFELPAHLRQRVTRHVLSSRLALCPPLAGLPPEVLQLLASRAAPVELPTGHDLFRLGEAAEGGVWVLERGVVFALRNQELVEAPSGPTGLAVPCLLGEGALLAELLPPCSSRLWTLRTERPCRAWVLRGPALRAALRLYPALATHLLAFVRERLLAWLAGGAEGEDECWCEVVQLLKRSFVMGPLRERIHDCYLALQLASVSDGSLVRLLAAWLGSSAAAEMTEAALLAEAEQLEERSSARTASHRGAPPHLHSHSHSRTLTAQPYTAQPYGSHPTESEAPPEAGAEAEQQQQRERHRLITPAATPDAPCSPTAAAAAVPPPGDGDDASPANGPGGGGGGGVVTLSAWVQGRRFRSSEGGGGGSGLLAAGSGTGEQLAAELTSPVLLRRRSSVAGGGALLEPHLEMPAVSARTEQALTHMRSSQRARYASDSGTAPPAAAAAGADPSLGRGSTLDGLDGLGALGGSVRGAPGRVSGGGTPPLGGPFTPLGSAPSAPLGGGGPYAAPLGAGGRRLGRVSAHFGPAPGAAGGAVGAAGGAVGAARAASSGGSRSSAAPAAEAVGTAAGVAAQPRRATVTGGGGSGGGGGVAAEALRHVLLGLAGSDGPPLAREAEPAAEHTHPHLSRGRKDPRVGGPADDADAAADAAGGHGTAALGREALGGYGYGGILHGGVATVASVGRAQEGAGVMRGGFVTPPASPQSPASPVRPAAAAPPERLQRLSDAGLGGAPSLGRAAGPAGPRPRVSGGGGDAAVLSSLVSSAHTTTTGYGVGGAAAALGAQVRSASNGAAFLPALLPATASGMAAAAAAAAAAQPAVSAAATLTRTTSNGHTSFLNKIFMAAGVPPPPSPPPAAAAPFGSAVTGAVAGACVPSIVAPACTTCGVATCAFCARTIVPVRALTAAQPAGTFAGAAASLNGAAAAATAAATRPGTASGLRAAQSLDVPAVTASPGGGGGGGGRGGGSRLAVAGAAASAGHSEKAMPSAFAMATVLEGASASGGGALRSPAGSSPAALARSATGGDIDTSARHLAPPSALRAASGGRGWVGGAAAAFMTPGAALAAAAAAVSEVQARLHAGSVAAEGGQSMGAGMAGAAVGAVDVPGADAVQLTGSGQGVRLGGTMGLI